MQSKQFKKRALLACFPFVLSACDSELPADSTTDPVTPNPGNGVVLVAQPAPVAPYPTVTGYDAAVGQAAGDDFLLGNPDYQAISYGSFRKLVRDSGENAPTVEEIKEDLLLLQAMGIKVLRTYHTQDYIDTERLLEAIDDLMNPSSPEYRDGFKMFVMLGIWVDAVNAWGGGDIDRTQGSATSEAEMAKALELVNLYPEIIKVMAVGNESMVHWANYHVAPSVVTDYVNQLQALKTPDFEKGLDIVDEIPESVWITSSDNWAVWSGQGDYAGDGYKALIEAVDYVSVHSYPFHDTHWDGKFWEVPLDEQNLSKEEQLNRAMVRAKEHVLSQVKAVQDNVNAIDPTKQIHIGETGWSSMSSDGFGQSGTKAADEYKQKLYHDNLRTWSNEFGASLFFFEAFDEQWKAGWDTADAEHSEKHFGLIDLDGKAKFLLWDMVEDGAFNGLTRGKDAQGNDINITKSFDGDFDALMSGVELPPYESMPVDGNNYSVIGEALAEGVNLYWWGGNSGIYLNEAGTSIMLTGGSESYPGWWGAGVQPTVEANLSGFESGSLHFDISATQDLSDVKFKLGMQTSGSSTTNHFVQVGGGTSYPITTTTQSYSIPLTELAGYESMDLSSVVALMFVLGEVDAAGESYIPDGVSVEISNVYYSK
jgi:exo-beta-1,3-glucanase (GH17 family)